MLRGQPQTYSTTLQHPLSIFLQSESHLAERSRSFIDPLPPHHRQQAQRHLLPDGRRACSLYRFVAQMDWDMEQVERVRWRRAGTWWPARGPLPGVSPRPWPASSRRCPRSWAMARRRGSTIWRSWHAGAPRPAARPHSGGRSLTWLACRRPRPGSHGRGPRPSRGSTARRG